MQIVTYNTHYGVGRDGRYEIARIADAVRGADVIALQEVSRGNPANQHRDMVAELRDALPDYFAAFGANFEADIGSQVEAGRALDRMFQLGNMILSKTPVKLSRNLLLPRTRSYETLNFQRGALEVLLMTPRGPIRFYATHLDHRSPEERLSQVRFLRDRVLGYPLEGGGLTGVGEAGWVEPPHTEDYIVLGDFNMLEGSPEYAEMAGTPDHEFGMPVNATRAIDVARRLAKHGDDMRTYADLAAPDDARPQKRIDYIFASPALAPSLSAAWVDHAAIGSDHYPVWLELA